MKWIPITIILCSWFPSQEQRHTNDYNDRMGVVDKNQLKNISQELLIEAYLKARQVNYIRDVHSTRLPFDIGLVMGNIRERYRRMMEIYREFRDKHSGRSKFFPSAFRYRFTAIYFINAMEMVHTLEVDIDKLVHVLETIDDDDINPDPRYERIPPRKKWLRTNDKQKIARMAAEQEIKSRAREQHLMRRLGLSAKLRTTGKRFQQRWPVERSWDLGAYADMGIYSKR